MIFPRNTDILQDVVDEANKSLSYPIDLELDNNSLLPYYNRNSFVIKYSEQSDLILLLFNLYPYYKKHVRKLLLIYMTLEINFERDDYDNVNQLLVRLEKEGGKLRMEVSTQKINDIYLDLQTLFIIGHETWHARFKQNKILWEKEIVETANQIRDIYQKPKTRHERWLFSKIPDVCNSTSQMEECACDRESVRYLAQYIKTRGYDSNKIECILRQILRLVTMLQYSKNLGELSGFQSNLKGINLHINKLVPDIIRIGILACVALDCFDEYDLENIGNILIEEVKEYNEILESSYKVGFRDLWILSCTKMDDSKINVRNEERCKELKESFVTIGKKIFSDLCALLCHNAD